MSSPTSEQLAQRLHDCSLISTRDIDTVFGELGSRDVALEELKRVLLSRGLVTNWQLERIEQGHVTGYIYGNYKILYSVGAGTFARVYRAVHVDTGEVRAIKVLRNRYAGDMATTERFLQEARMVMTLRHPNIVPIYEVENEQGRYYMVMDFIEGQNLRDFVRVHKRLSIRNALQITKDIAAGLDYAFQRGVTHRDLKLSNVLLSSAGRACLADFGLAGDDEFDGKNSDGGTNPRSIDYAGLERCTGVSRDDKRSDIFFLGCMLYHMLTGKPALIETRERIQRLSISRYKEIPPITVLAPDLPHRVVVLVNRMIDLNPDERLQTPGICVNETKNVMDALEAGETQQYDAKMAEREAEIHRLRQQKAEEGKAYTIMVVEGSVKLQDALREGLKKLGYRVLIFRDPKRALLRFEDTGFHDEEGRPKAADCVIFGTGDLQYDALDAFNHFGDNEETRTLPAILLTSEKQEYLLEEAKLSENRIHMSLPIKFRELRQELSRLLQQASTESPPTV